MKKYSSGNLNCTYVKMKKKRWKNIHPIIWTYLPIPTWGVNKKMEPKE
jgi:hypothetical protein